MNTSQDNHLKFGKCLKNDLPPVIKSSSGGVHDILSLQTKKVARSSPSKSETRISVHSYLS